MENEITIPALPILQAIICDRQDYTSKCNNWQGLQYNLVVVTESRITINTIFRWGVLFCNQNPIGNVINDLSHLGPNHGVDSFDLRSQIMT